MSKADKCEHCIGLFELYEQQLFTVTEKELLEELNHLVEEDFKQDNVPYMSNPSRDYFGLHKLCWTDFSFFNYCPNCGIKINKRKIKHSVNKGVNEHTNTLAQEFYKEYYINKQNPKPKQTKTETSNKKPKNGYVYVIKLGSSYKIGITSNPQKRFDSFSTLPYELDKICVEFVYDYRKVEKELHSKFTTKRKIGEWFDLDDYDIEYIKQYLSKRTV